MIWLTRGSCDRTWLGWFDLLLLFLELLIYFFKLLPECELIFLLLFLTYFGDALHDRWLLPLFGLHSCVLYLLRNRVQWHLLLVLLLLQAILCLLILLIDPSLRFLLYRTLMISESGLPLVYALFDRLLEPLLITLGCLLRAIYELEFILLKFWVLSIIPGV
jgi:hypothetical protein